MEKHLRKSQTLYSLSAFLFFFLCIVISLLGWYLQSLYFYLAIIVFSFLGLITHTVYINHLKKSLLTLIEMCETIIDQSNQNIPVIDGESYIAVLSNHLHMLDIRMKSMLEKLSQEQEDLKDYIEDISHQIKTPLTAMLLKEDILLEMTHGEEHRLIEQLIFQTQKIQYFIESLLHLAQIESHSIIYHFQEFTIDEIVHEVERNLQPLLEENDVHIQLHQNEIIYCDFQWMSEAVENIIKNCIEQKQHSSVEITCQNHHTYLQISIQDYGKGFVEEELPYIFERFSHQQYQKNNKSIGIGLSITKGVIDAHHGTIDAINHHGALFLITLPHKSTKSKYTVTNE